MGDSNLDKVVEDLRKRYDVSIIYADDRKDYDKSADAIPTGLLPLDIATGIGGVPRGYFTEVFSRDAVGKTTFCIQLVAHAQKLGLATVFIDMEHRIDPIWVETLGVKWEDMIFIQPAYGEAALNVVRALVESGDIDLIIIDSIPSLVPKVEIEGSAGDQFVGQQAKMIAQHFRQMTPLLRKSNVAVVFTNQIRSKIGGGGSLAYGPQYITPGGWALRFFVSLRIEMKKIKTRKDSQGNALGHIVRATTTKNSLATPLRIADLYLTHGIGFDNAESLIDMAVQEGLIEKSGAWYTIPPSDSNIQGRKNVADYLRENQEVTSAIEEKLLDIYLPREGSDEDSG
jgi:recombination protein RecA